jgi:hypothetical protein
MNKIGDTARFAIVSTARLRGIECEVLRRDQEFPPRRAGVLYIRELHAATSKGARATGPAVEYANARAHLVGSHEQLERELTGYVPGAGGPSPNRYDAHAHLVNELGGLAHDQPGERAKKDTRAAAGVAKEMQKRLLAAARGARVGI